MQDRKRKNTIMIRKKKKTLSGLLYEYKRSFSLFFFNKAAVMIIIGCFLRYWTTGTVNFFMSNYFKVYPENYSSYSDLTALASFAGGLFSTFSAGVIVDYFEKRTEMTIPMLCLVKAVIDIPCLLMTFF